MKTATYKRKVKPKPSSDSFKWGIKQASMRPKKPMPKFSDNQAVTDATQATLGYAQGNKNRKAQNVRNNINAQRKTTFKKASTRHK